MRASRWDTDAEIGGEWRVMLRRVADGEPIVLTQPTRMDLWAAGLDPVSASPTKTVIATLADNGLSGELLLTAADVTALGPGVFEHRVIASDEENRTTVLMRGRMTVRARVGDL